MSMHKLSVSIVQFVHNVLTPTFDIFLEKSHSKNKKAKGVKTTNAPTPGTEHKTIHINPVIL